MENITKRQCVGPWGNDAMHNMRRETGCVLEVLDGVHLLVAILCRGMGVVIPLKLEGVVLQRSKWKLAKSVVEERFRMDKRVQVQFAYQDKAYISSRVYHGKGQEDLGRWLVLKELAYVEEV